MVEKNAGIIKKINKNQKKTEKTWNWNKKWWIFNRNENHEIKWHLCITYFSGRKAIFVVHNLLLSMERPWLCSTVRSKTWSAE